VETAAIVVETFEIVAGRPKKTETTEAAAVVIAVGGVNVVASYAAVERKAVAVEVAVGVAVRVAVLVAV
jgi:hypothetical protein